MADTTTTPLRASGSPPPNTVRGRRATPRWVRVLTALLVAGMLAVAPTPHAPPAEAAVIGRMLAFGGWWVGSFVSSTGEFVYCIEPGQWEPSSQQFPGQETGTLPAYANTFSDPTGWASAVSAGPLSGERVRQINHVLWVHGRTTDPGTAVAVQFAIWFLRDDPGSRAWVDHHAAWVRAHGGAPYIDLAAAFADEARFAARAVPRTAPGALEIERDASSAGPNGEYEGVIRYPAGTTELRISGARFSDGSDRYLIAGDAAGSVRWRAEPHRSAWEGVHEVAVTGTWRRIAAEWPARLLLYSPMTAGQQSLVAGVAQGSVSFSGEFSATDATDQTFSPTLSTRVPQRFVASGDAFVDTVTLAAAPGSRPWPSRIGADGLVESMPLVAEGVLYGPFDTPQAQDAKVPDDAPVAARVRLLAERGPGDYRIVSDLPAERPGYYVWVWSIAAAAQTDAVRAGGVLPADTLVTDPFGLVAETQVVASPLRWRTALAEREIPSGRPVVHDRVTVDRGDSWLRDAAGDRIPIRLRLTVYRSDDRPERRGEAPGDAVEVARAFVDVHEPDTEVAADAIELPPGITGWVTVQACLWHEDQPEAWRGYAAEWCDDYGVPEETAAIIQPEVLSVTGASPGWPGVPSIVSIGLLGTGAGAGAIAGALARRRSRDRHRAAAHLQ